MMMTPKGNLDSKDVTLAYDDDTMGKIGSKDVTIAYDFGYFRLKSHDGGIFL